MVDTVEQLKIYNSRRRLRGAVMAAVSSPRWTYQSSLDSNSNAIEQFSDFGDDDISNSGIYIYHVNIVCSVIFKIISII